MSGQAPQQLGSWGEGSLSLPKSPSSMSSGRSPKDQPRTRGAWVYSSSAIPGLGGRGWLCAQLPRTL